MAHFGSKTNRRRFRDLPVAVPGSPQSQVDAINTIREAMLTFLGNFDPQDRVATYDDLAGLGLVDPRSFHPRVDNYRGVSAAKISGVLNTTINSSVWTAMPFGTVVAGNDRILKPDASGLDIRVSGLYFFNIRQIVPAFAAGTAVYHLGFRYLINGGSPVQFADYINTEDSTVIFESTIVELLSANDSITFEFTHNSAQTMTINNAHELSVMQLKGDPVQPWVQGVPQPKA